VQETGQIPDCGFYLPISVCRDATVLSRVNACQNFGFAQMLMTASLWMMERNDRVYCDVDLKTPRLPVLMCFSFSSSSKASAVSQNSSYLQGAEERAFFGQCLLSRHSVKERSRSREVEEIMVLAFAELNKETVLALRSQLEEKRLSYERISRRMNHEVRF